MLWILPAIIVSYLVGSVPTAYIFGRLLKNIDIRKFGSGNVGATNALRVLGKWPGITVLILDVIKGVLPVIFLGDFLLLRSTLDPQAALIILGLSCIAGHNWTIFLNFKGGKGMATTLGVLIGLAFRIADLKIILALLILIWLSVFLITRIVSLASLISALALPVSMVLFKQSVILVITSLILSAFVILRHKSNLSRLLRGKETKLTFK
jgi:glycerol-3-phosphate acyltransferase PlsY